MLDMVRDDKQTIGVREEDAEDGDMEEDDSLWWLEKPR